MKGPRTPYLNEKFSAAMDEFSAALKKTANLQNTGLKGGAREDSLLTFFNDRLPTRYKAVRGEVVDIEGRIGPQLDVMIFDQVNNFAFPAGANSVLPAEALLASIEIKTELNVGEIASSATAARKLRKLRPFGKVLGGRDIGGKKSPPSRYHHSIFAYNSNLALTGWQTGEAARLFSACGKDHVIDSVYVRGRGLINLNYKKLRIEDDQGGALTAFYFSILNFVLREGARRKPTPFERYTDPMKQGWKTVP